MKKQLYFIENVGCDDVTKGLREMTHEEFKFFCRVIYDLNLNSNYACMPRVFIYEANWNDFVEVSEQDLAADIYDENYVDFSDRIWMNNKCYTYKKNGFMVHCEYKQINVKEVCNEE